MKQTILTFAGKKIQRIVKHDAGRAYAIFHGRKWTLKRSPDGYLQVDKEIKAQK